MGTKSTSSTFRRVPKSQKESTLSGFFVSGEFQGMLLTSTGSVGRNVGKICCGWSRYQQDSERQLPTEGETGTSIDIGAD
ncbi:MAG: hypothetical protein H7835_06360 [Magnetococcus sp. XQGC-1]